MKFEVYCDETLPDLLTSGKPEGSFMMIGSLWLPAEMREEAKRRILGLRDKHAVHGEMKWRKISPSKLDFYTELVDLFMSFGLDMRFRCIAVDHAAVNLKLLNGDAELGFYKFYYQVIHHWILDNNEYSIFCDLKLNRDRSRLPTLQKILRHANKSSNVYCVQSLPSSEVVLLQLCDVLLGAVSCRMNGRTDIGKAKLAIVEHLEHRLNRAKLGQTARSEDKFNVFRINLGGGW